MTNTRWRKRLLISVPFTILICLGCGPLKGFSSWHNALQGLSTYPQILLRKQKRNKDTVRCVEQSARCRASRTQCFKPVGLLNRTCPPWKLPRVHFPVVPLAFLATVERLLAPWALLELVLRVQPDAEGLPCRCVHRLVPPTDEATVVGMVGHRQGHGYGDNWQVFFIHHWQASKEQPTEWQPGGSKLLTTNNSCDRHIYLSESILLFDESIGYLAKIALKLAFFNIDPLLTTWLLEILYLSLGYRKWE